MSLFKKFRKKRETSDKKEEISEGGLSEQDAGKKQAVKTADSNESKNIYIESETGNKEKNSDIRFVENLSFLKRFNRKLFAS